MCEGAPLHHNTKTVHMERNKQAELWRATATEQAIQQNDATLPTCRRFLGKSETSQRGSLHTDNKFEPCTSPNDVRID